MGHPLAGPNNTGPAHCWDRGGIAHGVGRWRRQSIRRWPVTRWAATVARAWRSGSRLIWGERGVGGGLTGDVRGGTCGWWGTSDGSWCRWSRGLMSGPGSGVGTRWSPWWRKDPSSWCFGEASSWYRRLKILGNSLKNSLNLIFHNVNLYWHTCMKNLEVPLQVVIMTWFNNIQRKDLTLTMNLNQDTL
jgi:hypothetical protein